MTPTQHNDIAGAIFDFAGFLTAHKEVIAVGATASASPMVWRIQEWAEARGLSLEAPNVMAWNDALAEPAPQLLPKFDTEWTPCMKLPVVVHVRSQRPNEQHVSTREGITPVKPDDLIMRGVSGEEYPIGRAIFEQTYTTELEPAVKPVQTTCNCRWEGDTQVQECTLHQAHKDAIHEWAERAKTAEAKLAATVREPVSLLTDDEISDIAIANPPDVHTYGRAIEQAVRQKAGLK